MAQKKTSIARSDEELKKENERNTEDALKTAKRWSIDDKKSKDDKSDKK